MQQSHMSPVLTHHQLPQQEEHGRLVISPNASITSNPAVSEVVNSNGGRLIMPSLLRRPSVPCGFDQGGIIPSEIVEIGFSGEVVIDGVTPRADQIDSVISEAARSFKRTGAGGPSGRQARGPAPQRSPSFGNLRQHTAAPGDVFNNPSTISQGLENSSSGLHHRGNVLQMPPGMIMSDKMAAAGYVGAPQTYDSTFTTSSASSSIAPPSPISREPTQEYHSSAPIAM